MKLKRQTFDYFYMFVMVIYMAQMSHATNTLFSVSGDASILGILIPNILTLILIVRNKKKLGESRRLGVICALVLAWIVVIAVKFGMGEARSGLYTLYYILVAYIQVRVYGKSLFLYYEDIMVLMAKITTVMWLLGVLLPPVDQLYTMFPLSSENANRTMDGYNILFLFCWNHTPYELIPRNVGFAWEPGRYAIMVALAILINLYRNGIKFSNNTNIIWLLISLASTQSTTGFSVTMVLYLYFAVKRINFKYIFIALMVFVPLIYAVSRLDFMADKIVNQIGKLNIMDSKIEALQWNQAHNPNYRVSLDRFLSIFLEYQNIHHDPMTGYGPTTNQSYFSRMIAENATLTGGLLKILGIYGIPLGLFFYLILFRSSSLLARSFGSKKIWGFFIFVLMSSVSYPIFGVALFTSLWFYGAFDENTDKIKHVASGGHRKRETVLSHRLPTTTNQTNSTLLPIGCKSNDLDVVEQKNIVPE